MSWPKAVAVSAVALSCVGVAYVFPPLVLIYGFFAMIMVLSIVG